MTITAPTSSRGALTESLKENETRFLRLRPRMRLHEIYCYDVRLRETTTVLPREGEGSDPSRSGKLEIDIPFVPSPSGAPGLDHNSFLDAYHLSRSKSGAASTTARIGHVQFSLHPTDRDEANGGSHEGPDRQKVDLRCEGSKHPGVMALDVPIENMREYFRRQSHVTRTIDYEIEASPLVSIEARIQKTSFTDHDESRIEDVQKFELAFNIRSDHKLSAPILENLSFDFPLSLMWTVGRGSDFSYDPRDQKLRLLSGREFSTPDQKPDKQYDSSLRLKLNLQEASRLLNLKFLRGSGVVRFPGMLLSSLDTDLYDATGHRFERPLLEKSSAFHFTIEIDLAAAMARFTWNVARNLVFDGVIPEPGRLEDIRAVFADEGIQLGDWNKDGNAGFDCASGKRQLDGEETRFEIRVRGKTAQIVQKLMLQGGGETTREIASGRLTIQIEAQHSSPRALNEHLNKIQRLLKERLDRFRVT